MITITGLVYAIVLAPDANPVGLGVYTNIGYHYISPWATVLGFLLFGPRPRFRVKTVFAMLAIPVVWLTYTLLRGLLLVTPHRRLRPQLGEPQNWYPYPFIDVNDPSPLIRDWSSAGTPASASTSWSLCFWGYCSASSSSVWTGRSAREQSAATDIANWTRLRKSRRPARAPPRHRLRHWPRDPPQPLCASHGRLLGPRRPA